MTYLDISEDRPPPPAITTHFCVNLGQVRYSVDDEDNAWIDAHPDASARQLIDAIDVAAIHGLELIPPDEAPPVPLPDGYVRRYLTIII